MSVDKERIEAATRELLLALGEDPDREGLQETPRRVADAWKELLTPRADGPWTTFTAQQYAGIVVLRDIPFHSFCEHHLLPFLGKAHIAYIPTDRVLGLSKLARILEVYTRRLQLQERLTEQVADEINETVDADGVAVVIEAEHLCMTIRGAQKPDATTVTSALRGVFMEKPEARQEVMRLCRGR